MLFHNTCKSDHYSVHLTLKHSTYVNYILKLGKKKGTTFLLYLLTLASNLPAFPPCVCSIFSPSHRNALSWGPSLSLNSERVHEQHWWQDCLMPGPSPLPAAYTEERCVQLKPSACQVGWEEQDLPCPSQTRFKPQ